MVEVLVVLQFRSLALVTLNISVVVGGFLGHSRQHVVMVTLVGVFHCHDVERFEGLDAGFEHGHAVVGLRVIADTE